MKRIVLLVLLIVLCSNTTVVQARFGLDIILSPEPTMMDIVTEFVLCGIMGVVAILVMLGLAFIFTAITRRPRRFYNYINTP